MSRPVPESLLQEGLRPVWAAARARLDRYGPQRRGTVSLPELDPDSALTLRSLLGSVPRRLDLSRLESAMVARGIGIDLEEALTRLGHPPCPEAARRRDDKARAARAREALTDSSREWPEPWAQEWARDVEQSGLLAGLDDADVAAIVTDVRRLLDSLDCAVPPSVEDAANASGSGVVSRTELAARLFGSAHALDSGRKLAAFVVRALKLGTGASDDGRGLWEAAGILPDYVSAPVLVWGVPATGDSPVAHVLNSASSGGMPIHLSLFGLRRHPVRVPAGTQVLVVENPRLVEAAAERSSDCCVVAANGNPTRSVTTLVEQLRDSGATVWYHGDFDAAGLRICRRMHELGCSPWMMNADDYQAAVEDASSRGVALGADAGAAGPTPWDPQLEVVFDASRLIIHEEFVLGAVLSEFARMAHQLRLGR